MTGIYSAPLPRVLVIDDDPLQLELVERSLRRDGFDVSTAGTAGSIASRVREFAPEIVLIDLNMPGAADGAALEIARRAAVPGAARFVLYSASDDSKLRALAFRLEADAWISKSVSAAEIGKKLTEIHRRVTSRDSNRKTQ